MPPGRYFLALFAALGALAASAATNATGGLGAPGPSANRTVLANPDAPAFTTAVRRGSPAALRAGVDRGELSRELGNLIDQAGSGSGVWVADAESGEEVFERRGNDKRILASNTKLFTTATALELIGAREKLTTTVVTGGEIANGTLSGNLFLVGDGDPALAGRSFARRHGFTGTPIGRLAKQIKEAGIKRVRGDLLADDSIFDGVRGVPDSSGNTSPYIGPLSGLSYNENRRGGGFVSNPETATAEELKKGLENRGVEVGRVAERRAPEDLLDAPALAETSSAPLDELVEDTNRPSNNFFAETLLKRLDTVDGDQGTTKGGTEDVEAFAHELGSDVNAVDGSGLTRSNTASPQDVGELLLAMREHPAERSFKRSLPKAGSQGTLAGRMRGTAAEGRCRAKTGTISGVSALSGYCRAKGTTMVFSILMNGVNVTSARQIQDRMAAVIARYKP
ncbi:MAG: D-alanyl-D-alanine carboxypeptidase/D-alanyl-D-alanine endopeptidase [Solirubrobacterales bacterium]